MDKGTLDSIIVLLWPGAFWALSLSLAILVIPIERLFPRVAQQPFRKGRNIAILSVALCTFLEILLYYHVLQAWLIDMGLAIKFASMSRWAIPDWLLLVLSILLLDFIHYALHRLAHTVPPLWRMHAVHHSDEHVTALTTALQHPGEIFWAQVVHILIAVAIGIPVLTYFYYGFARAIHGVFTHIDVYLPSWCEKLLRWFIVTPDVHRIHHSLDMKEGNSNFGSMFTIWDRLFGTLIIEAKESGANFRMGVPTKEGLNPGSPVSLLFGPFRRRSQ